MHTFAILTICTPQLVRCCENTSAAACGSQIRSLMQGLRLIPRAQRNGFPGVFLSGGGRRRGGGGVGGGDTPQAGFCTRQGTRASRPVHRQSRGAGSRQVHLGFLPELSTTENKLLFADSFEALAPVRYFPNPCPSTPPAELLPAPLPARSGGFSLRYLRHVDPDPAFPFGLHPDWHCGVTDIPP